jgi:hypothetical protein
VKWTIRCFPWADKKYPSEFVPKGIFYVCIFAKSVSAAFSIIGTTKEIGEQAKNDYDNDDNPDKIVTKTEKAASFIFHRFHNSFLVNNTFHMYY